jgi:hypothetical protein
MADLVTRVELAFDRHQQAAESAKHAVGEDDAIHVLRLEVQALALGVEQALIEIAREIESLRRGLADGSAL